MTNATCSEIHMEVLLPGIYSIPCLHPHGSMYHFMCREELLMLAEDNRGCGDVARGTADDGLHVLPSGCSLQKDSTREKDRAL